MDALAEELLHKIALTAGPIGGVKLRGTHHHVKTSLDSHDGALWLDILRAAFPDIILSQDSSRTGTKGYAGQSNCSSIVSPATGWLVHATPSLYTILHSGGAAWAKAVIERGFFRKLRVHMQEFSSNILDMYRFQSESHPKTDGGNTRFFFFCFEAAVSPYGFIRMQSGPR
jgi:hypothetical protein